MNVPETGISTIVPEKSDVVLYWNVAVELKPLGFSVPERVTGPSSTVTVGSSEETIGAVAPRVSNSNTADSVSPVSLVATIFA